MSGQVVDQAGLLVVVQHLAVQVSGLRKVVVGVPGLVALGHARHLLGVLAGVLQVAVGLEGVRVVVRPRSAVSVHCHQAVALGVAHARAVGAVNGDLGEVGAQAVAVGVGVGEKAALEHAVERWLDSGDQVARRKGGLLDVLEVVFGVAVQHQLAHGDAGVVRVRPDLGHVEDVPAVLVAVGLGHDLDLHRPGHALARLQGVEERAGRVVGVRGLELVGLRGVQVLYSLVGEVVELDPEGLVLLVDPLEGVAAESVHVEVAVGGAAVRE